VYLVFFSGGSLPTLASEYDGKRKAGVRKSGTWENAVEHGERNVHGFCF